MAKRNLLRYRRSTDLLMFSTIQPVMFVLMFAFVFGGAIDTPGGSYVNFLLPGIMVMSVLFGSTQTGIGLAEDSRAKVLKHIRCLWGYEVTLSGIDHDSGKQLYRTSTIEVEEAE